MRVKRTIDEQAIESEIGSRIRIARRALDKTQAELADHIGITMQQIQKYEHGKSRISAARLLQIAAALSRPIDFFTDDLPVAVYPII